MFQDTDLFRKAPVHQTPPILSESCLGGQLSQKLAEDLCCSLVIPAKHQLNLNGMALSNWIILAFSSSRGLPQSSWWKGWKIKAQQTIEDPILGYVDRTIVHQWRPLKVTNQTSCTTVPRDQDTTPPPCDQEEGKKSYLSVGCGLCLYLTQTLSPKGPFFVVSQKPMPFAQLTNEVSPSTGYRSWLSWPASEVIRSS